MNWHYLDNGQPNGPVGDEQFAELKRTGIITGDTMVWREGMADWLPLSQINPDPIPAGVISGSGGTKLSLASAGADQTTAACSECGKIFPVDEMIQHGSSRICANCKPIFMQKLAEGARISTVELNYAPILTRFAAVFLDGLMLWVVNILIGMVAGFTLAQAVGVEPRGFGSLTIILLCVQMAIPISYEVFMIGKYGATLGKMACKIKVVTAEGGQVSYARAFGRYFAKIVSSMICLIGYIMACFDDQKRALHDRICNTRVIYK